MEAQLDFTWQHNPVVWKPATVSVKEEKFEMPEQLDFKLAEPPAIPNEKPVPLSFTNGGKKLIQYKGEKEKFKPKPAVVKKNSKIKEKKVVKKEVKAKPDWNCQNNTLGLFDPGISKKMPIELKHAIKNDPKIMPKPKFFQDPIEIPSKKPASKNLKPGTEGKLAENLEIKFIADQEEIVKKLEKQLEIEKQARAKLDQQFSEKMKEYEKIAKKNKPEAVEKARVEQRTGYEVQVSPQVVQKVNQVSFKGNQLVSAGQKPLIKPSQPARLENKSPEKYLKFEEYRQKYADIDEIPTHDIGPMVLPAQSKQVSAKYRDTSPSPAVRPKAEPQIQILEPRTKSQHIQFESHNIESDPILNSLSAAMVRYKAADQYSSKTVSAVSQFGGKYIAYYANELSDMLIDDFLEETVYDLQRIETKKIQQAHFEFSSEAEKHFNTILKDFEEETKGLQAKHLKDRKKDNFLDRILNDWGEEEIIIEDKRREWDVQIEEESLTRIRVYRKKFEDYQKIVAGGSDGKLWEIYAIIGDEVIDEIIAEVAKEYDETLEEFTERFINNEFA